MPRHREALFAVTCQREALLVAPYQIQCKHSIILIILKGHYTLYVNHKWSSYASHVHVWLNWNTWTDTIKIFVLGKL